VPVPVDPVTGKPFEYEVKGDKARLDPPSTGVEEPKYQMIRYEITVRR
jgi:hypothetical protein